MKKNVISKGKELKCFEIKSIKEASKRGFEKANKIVPKTFKIQFDGKK